MVLAKTTKPLLSRSVKRERLFRRLDAAAPGGSIWVDGPAGSGKTTLVNGFINARALESVWYRLEEGDGDISSFFHYLGAALDDASDPSLPPMPHLTPEYVLGVPAFIRDFFEKAFTRLPERTAIVFDDCHAVPAGSRLWEILGNVVLGVPPGIMLIFIGRIPPPETFSRAIANGLVHRIPWADLRLTFEEAAEIASLWEKQGQLDERLFHRTNGWAAGLVLLLANRDADEGKPADPEHPETLFGYFNQEVLERLPPAAATALLKVSFLPKVTSEAAVSMTADPKFSVLLDQLARQNFFIFRSAAEAGSYWFHPLFLEFLNRKARETFGTTEIARLQEQSAGLLAQTGEIEAAVENLAGAGRWEKMIALLLQHAPMLIAQGRHRVLLRWIQLLPQHSSRVSPWLDLWRGACVAPGDPTAGLALLESAFRSFGEERDVLGQYVAWAGIVDAIIFSLGGYERLDHWVQVLEELIEEHGELPFGEVWVRVCAAMFGALVVRNPGHPHFDLWRFRAVEIVRHPSAKMFAASIWFNEAFAGQIVGDYTGAAVALDALRNIKKTQDVSPLARLTAMLAEAQQANAAADHAACRAVVEKGLAFARNSGVHLFDFLLVGQLVWSSLNHQDEETAEKYFSVLEASPLNPLPWNATLFHYLKSFSALVRGDLEFAARYAERSVELAALSGAFVSDCLCLLLRAQIEAERGDFEAAEEFLKRLEKRNAEAQAPLYIFMCRITRAWTAFKQGQENALAAELAGAFALGRRLGVLNTPLWRSDLMTHLCREALTREIETDYATQLIRYRRLVPETPPMDVKSWPWSLRIHTLGRFEILRDDKPLRSSGKSQQRPLELLKTLIALGGRDVAETRLSDALWPDADGDAARQAFKTTLHRLRKLLGAPEALEFTDGRLTLNPRVCWVDAWALDRLFDQAESCLNQSASREKEKGIASAIKAFDLYEGAFLHDDSSMEISIPMRERLRSRFLRCVEHLGTRLEEMGRCKEVIGIYRRALEIDPLVEFFYQRLMICYRDLGRPAEALAVYDRCRTALEQTLGVGPSETTYQFYRSIRISDMD